MGLRNQHKKNNEHTVSLRDDDDDDEQEEDTSSFSFEIQWGKKRMEIRLPINATVHELRDEIKQIWDIPENNQRLYFHNSLIKTSQKPLIELGIKEGSKVKLVGAPSQVLNTDDGISVADRELIEQIKKKYPSEEAYQERMDALEKQVKTLSTSSMEMEVKKTYCQLHEELMQAMLDLDGIIIETENSPAKAYRKQAINTIHKYLDHLDLLAREHHFLKVQ